MNAWHGGTNFPGAFKDTKKHKIQLYQQIGELCLFLYLKHTNVYISLLIQSVCMEQKTILSAFFPIIKLFIVIRDCENSCLLSIEIG